MARPRRDEEEQLWPGRASQAVWALLLDGRIDPAALAALLRDGLGASERRRAYLELVRDLGAPAASQLWNQALATPALSRGELPADARRIVEAALGRRLGRVDIMRGPAVDALTARMGSPAFTLGRQVFVRGGEASTPVLVHEAIHVAQQERATPTIDLGQPSQAAEREAHSILRRLGPLDAAPSLLADRARASRAVGAALGRAPKVTARPAVLAAYEVTHASVDSVLSEARRLSEALVALLERGATKYELQRLLGPEYDAHQARVRATAIHGLGGRKLGDGRAAREALAQKLGGLSARPGKPLPGSLKAELESRLGASFDEVRVHDDSGAADDARKLGARAFTQGRDVYFGQGKYDPQSAEGKRLIAHELTHVAQQAGAAETSAPTVSAPGSAVEREADRVSHAFADGDRAGTPQLQIRERAPAGTISRDSEGGASPTQWRMNVMQRALDLSANMPNARDLGDGRKQIDVNQSMGPIRIQNATFRSSGDHVESGTLSASVDSGPFHGGQGQLSVDAGGAVSGTLTLPVNVPGALVKNVQVQVGPDGFSGTANISPADLLSHDFPVQATDFVVTVRSSPAAGVEVSITGGATVNVANGMASGSAQMTATLQAGPSGVTFNATINGNLQIAGLAANVQATITWDGHNISITAGADVPVSLPGIEGIAHVSYAGGRLSVVGENVKFTIPQLSAILFDDVRAEDGRLKASLRLGTPVSMPLPGGGTASLTASTVQIDGTDVSGEATGRFSVGPGGAAALAGALRVSYQGGQLDGSVTVENAQVPGIQVQGLTIGVEDAFRANRFSVAGDVTVNLLDGLVVGRWANLAMDPGGSLTGQVNVHFGIPRIGLPDVNLNVLPGWRISASTAGGPISLDLGGALGQLSELTASVQIGETDIRDIGRAFGDITVTGSNIAPPALAAYGALDSLSLNLPGAGGSYDFARLSGSAALRISAFPGAPISINLRYANGELSTEAEVNVDVHAIVPALAGSVRVGYVSGQANPLSIHAAGLTASDPRIAQYVSIPNVDYADGNLSGDINFASGPISVGPVTGSITSGHLHFSKAQSGPVQLTGSVDVQMAAAGAGASATGHISYDDQGQLKVEGTITVDLAGLTGGKMTGMLTASNEGGANSLACADANFAEGPLVGVFTNGISVRKTGEALSASATLDVAALQRLLPGGVTASGSLTLSINKANAGDTLHIGATGSAKVTVGSFLEANIALTEEGDGGIGATLTVPQDGIKLTIPGATITGSMTLHMNAQRQISLEAAAVDVNVLSGTVTAHITPIIEGGRPTGVTVAGNVRDTQFTQPADFTFTYNAGQWGGSTSVTFKDLGGIVQAGASMTLGYDSQTGINAHAENIALAGPLNGLFIDEAHLNQTGYGATIRGGRDITVGSVRISIDPASQLTIDSANGLTGTASGNVRLGALPQINVSVTARGTGQPIDIHADTDIPLAQVSQYLAGNLHVTYDRNGGANAFSFTATDVMVNAGPVQNQVLFSNITAHLAGQELTGSLTAARVTLHVGAANVTIDGGTIDLLPGRVLNGQLTAHMAAGGANAHASVGWNMGQFTWEAGGTVQLGEVTGHRLEGEVEASAGSGGAAALHNNGPITFGTAAPEAVRDVAITSVRGNLQTHEFHVAVQASAAINKLTRGMQDLHIHVADAPVTVDYVGGALAMAGHIQGTASYSPGDQEKVGGNFQLGFDSATGFTGLVDQIRITAGEGFHSEGGSIDLRSGAINIGTCTVNISGVGHGTVTGGGNVKERTFGLDADVDITALRGLKVHVHADNREVTGTLTAPVAIQIGPATVTLMDGCTARFARGAGGGFSSTLHARVDMPHVGHAVLTAEYARGHGFSGTAALDIDPIAIFDRTSGTLQYEGGNLSTQGEGFTLNLASQYATYLDASVHFRLDNNRPDVRGQIKRLKELGKISEAFQGAEVRYNEGVVTASADFDLAPVIPGGLLRPNSMLHLEYANSAVSVHGTLRPNDLGPVHFDQASQISASWSSATRRVDINGHAHADINHLATVDLDVTANAGGGDPASFDLRGHIDATGLGRYIPGVTFGAITGDVALHVGGGTTDFNVQVDADVTGIPAAGITDCAAHLHGEYQNGQGLSGYVAVSRIKVGEVIADGRVDVVRNRFSSGTLHVLADFPSLRIEGNATVAAGAELSGLSTSADLTVTPGGNSALARFISSGSIHIAMQSWQLQEARGRLNLVPPSFLPLQNPVVEISYVRGSGISATLSTQFEAPFRKNNEMGNFVAGYSSAQGLFAHIDFPITIPGFQQATVAGDLNQNGVTISATLVPRDNAVIKSATVSIGYGSGGFFFEGKVKIAPSESMELEVGVRYQQGQGFQILGITPEEKHPDDGDKELASWHKDFPTIPLLSVGVASIGLKFGMGVAAGYRMPKIKLKDPKIEGGLEALDSGGLPPISFGGSIAMGAYLALSFSVQIAGEIQLLIATASAGIGAEITARLNLELGADVTGRFQQGQGALLKIDPFVGASLDLIASLIATLYAEVCWFTIIDKKYTLASVTFAHIDLGQFRPFNPIELQVGGPGGTRFVNGLALRDDAIDQISNGVKEGGKNTSDAESNREAKEKIAPVLKSMRAAAGQFEQLPEGWENGMTAAPVDFNSMFGISGAAWDFYREHADNAEQIDPEDACTTPTQKLAKGVAIASKTDPMRAGRIVLEWRRAQIAHMGINPDTGVNVVLEREEVQGLIQVQYLAAVAEVQRKQKEQDEEHARHVAKQAADFQKAEHEHQHKIHAQKAEHEQKVKHHEAEGKKAQHQVEEAEKQAQKEGAVEKPAENEKAPPPAPPPQPAPPPALAKPDPIPVPPPIPLPPPMVVLPAVTLPALPSDPGVSASAAGAIPPASKKAEVQSPGAASPQTGGAPNPAPGAASGAAAQVGGGGGGGAGAGGGGGGGGGRPGGGGGGAATPPGPAVAAGAAGIISQARTLDAKKAQLQGGGGGGAAAGGGAPAPATAAAAAAATGGAPGAAAAGGKDKNANAKKDAAPAGQLDPTVQKVAAKGKADEDKQQQALQSKEHEYKQKIEVKTKGAVKATSTLTKAADDAHKRHEMPPAGAFLPGNADQARIAFSNFIKLKREGESFASFKDKYAQKKFFNFDAKVWADVVQEMQKIHDAMKPEEALPDPKDWTAKLYAGNTYEGKSYKQSAGFDAGYSLSDETLKALETFEKFKTNNRGHKPGQYLVAEVEKMPDAEKTAFVTAKLTALAAAAEVAKVLRVALDKLGPAAVVGQRLAAIDGGGVVPAPQFWAAMQAAFNAGAAGLAQINQVVAQVQAKGGAAAGAAPA
ncbi:MAG: hypothetical protein JWN44_5108, partial [Myxococcales bacterium]|nr:hypothetical protein [Myxococcales bacterium]